ncbi:ParB N-terminal domain-containing protein [Paenibacillus sp. FSL H7-0716]|uniref:Chromosome partitioning protein ParB n=1 Tax=Paenibacillus odorifer TaxID=189426 RepID=A0AB36JEW0_9BACL|nr:ParB N-terminal domain-containing protein [Paenibacillus odorifer]OME16582.1 chromosome partitioning protein ParB [Paenibacillus odorifer]
MTLSKRRTVPKLGSIDELLKLSEQSYQEIEELPITIYNIQLIPISKIRYFKPHPFRLYEGERLSDMVESIATNGVLVPVIIRKVDPDENDYEFEMLAGHNRMNAASLAGLDQLPCIIKEYLSDDEALLYVVETNVLQRSFSDLLPSEKAKVLTLRYSTMFSQGKRNDIIDEIRKFEDPQYTKEKTTSSLLGTKLRSDEKLGLEYGLSKNTIARLLRIEKLSLSLKKRVDDGQIGLYPAVSLSYLSLAEQNILEDALTQHNYKVDMKKADLLRNFSGNSSAKQIEKILSGEINIKSRSKSASPFKLKYEVYAKYFTPQIQVTEAEEIIDKALKMYFAFLQQQGAKLKGEKQVESSTD